MPLTADERGWALVELENKKETDNNGCCAQHPNWSCNSHLDCGCIGLTGEWMKIDRRLYYVLVSAATRRKARLICAFPDWALAPAPATRQPPIIQPRHFDCILHTTTLQLQPHLSDIRRCWGWSMPRIIHLNDSPWQSQPTLVR